MKSSWSKRLMAGLSVAAVLLATTPGAFAVRFCQARNQEHNASDHGCPCCCDEEDADGAADPSLQPTSEHGPLHLPCPCCPNDSGGCSFCSVAKVVGFVHLSAVVPPLTFQGRSTFESASLYVSPFDGAVTPPPKAA